MTRFPNPFTAVSEIVAKAFAIVGDRDGAGRRDGFGIGLSHARSRRPAHTPASQAQAPSTRDGSSESLAKATEKSGA
jgi:hypothetical protein